MKLSVSSSELLKKLLVVNGAVGVNNVRPILENFLFELSGNELSVSATDLQTSIRTKVIVNGEVDGDTAIPAKILVDTLRALPEQPITLELNENKDTATLTSDTGKYVFACVSAEDFPALTEPEDRDTSISLDSDILRSAISNTIFATSTEELRLAMTGVLFNLDFNKINFVATDAHKLVRYTYSGISTSDNSSFIIPKKSLQLLRNALPGSEEISMTFNDAHAFFYFGDSFIAVRLIDAQYPNYSAVIPTNNPIKVNIDRISLLNALKRIAHFANKTTNQVIFHINQNAMVIEAQDIDFSNEATETIPCTYEEEPITIGFNAKSMAEMLSTLDTDEIIMEMSTPTRATLLLPGTQEDKQDLLMLIMPVVMGR